VGNEKDWVRRGLQIFLASMSQIDMEVCAVSCQIWGSQKNLVWKRRQQGRPLLPGGDYCVCLSC